MTAYDCMVAEIQDCIQESLRRYGFRRRLDGITSRTVAGGTMILEIDLSVDESQPASDPPSDGPMLRSVP